jgi:FtsH-binding integral membrane protein
MSRRKVLEVLIEVLLAILFVCSVAVYAIYVPPEKRVGRNMVGVTAVTLLVFGFSISQMRAWLNQRRIWLFFAAALAAHCTGWFVLLRAAGELPFVVFAVIGTAEIGVILKISRKAVDASAAGPRMTKKP